MISWVGLFEDEEVAGLAPLATCRPVFELFLGTSRLIEKVSAFWPQVPLVLKTREWLSPLVRERFPLAMVDFPVGPGLLINARLVMTLSVFEQIQRVPEASCLFQWKGTTVAAKLEHPALASDLAQISPVYPLEKAIVLSKPWDLVAHNPQVLTDELEQSEFLGHCPDTLGHHVSLVNPTKIGFGKNVQIEDFTYITAQNGPVYLADDVYVESHTRLEGPLYIGPGTRILGGRIKSSTIGPICKVGGEVSCSVISGLSNKGHDGFLGHSYLGYWVNLGAGTTTSNLKNTYGPIRAGQHNDPTDQVFLGSMMGDYVRTGIGTLLTCGSLIGTGSTLFGSTLHQKGILPFSWGESHAYETCEIEGFLRALDRMMARRMGPVPPEEKAILTQYFQKIMKEAAQ